MRLGLLDAKTLRAGLDQTLPRPDLRDLAAKLRALAGEPALAAGLATAVARAPRCARCTRRTRAAPTASRRGRAASTACSAPRDDERRGRWRRRARRRAPRAEVGLSAVSSARTVR